VHTRIVTVLRSGGDFGPEHVRRLFAQCREHAPESEFVCLSDDRSVPGYRPLSHDWPGWWAKIEAFSVSGPVLYLDLDTTITGDLSPLLAAASAHDLVVLRDFNPGQREIGTGVMAWRGDLAWLARRFGEDPAGHMAANETPRWWGDQGFVERHADGWVCWQEILPGAVVSFKKHCAGGVPAGARVIAFHGQPRPWELEVA